MRRPARNAVASCVVALVAAACAPDNTTTPQGSSVTVVPSPTVGATPQPPQLPQPRDTEPPAADPAATPVTASSEPEALRLDLFSTAVDEPIALVVAPVPGELWLADKGGEVVAIDGATGARLRTIVDLSGEVSTGTEQGLLGLAVAPNGSALYLSFTDANGTSRLDSVTLSGGGANLTTRRTLLEVAQPFGNHNGGHLAVGPDGYLYLGLGDGGSRGDPEGNGQDTSTLLGSILRLDPVGGAPYAIPADNPFANGGGRPEIWTWGVRNPWRFSFDRANGDLWVGDVGQNDIEEIDLLPRTSGAGRGVNLGWNTFEGAERFDGGEAAPAGVSPTPPVFDYSHAEGCSVTGGFVYRGNAIAGLDGWYVYADYCRPELRGLRIAADGALLAEGLDVRVPEGLIVSFAETGDGELLVLTNGPGQIWRLAPAA